MSAERWLRAVDIPTRRPTALRGPARFRAVVCPNLVMLLLGLGSPVQAYDVADWLSVGGIVAAGGQCRLVSGDSSVGGKCRVGLPAQTEVSLRPTDSDEVFVKLGFAMSDGLSEASPFALSPWAADLHEDVKGLRVDHLLNAWYKHSFALGKEITLGVTGGVIDATDYLNDNAYSNDEYTQFMSEALVNAPNAFLPSYDLGGALELDMGRWSASGVVMRIDENGDGSDFTFWGWQLGYRTENRWGEGNYRLFVVGASRDFLDPTGTGREKRLGIGLSFDQQLGETFGAFLRLAWQDDDAAITYDSLYSGGINVRGEAWGRSDDEIGAAFGFLDGGNLDLRRTRVAEVYYRLAISEHFALTADAQYLRDTVKADDDPHGLVLGLRATFEF